MRRFLLGLALALAAPAGAQTDANSSPAWPGWLAGAWQQASAEGNWSDEFWTPPRAGIMIGAARIGQGDKLAMFEHTRIMRKPDGSLAFYAQPRGVAASEFPLVASGAQMIEFANAAHDYPQRIRYWREGRFLKARISLFDGTQAYEWTYRAMGSSE
jgi:Domain of unknown function (DUF6265)